MSVISLALESLEFNRVRTLGLLDGVAQLPDPQAALGWRPAPGRAHAAWHLMHVGITEELFATERLAPPKAPGFPLLLPRFRGGSTPDEQIPRLDEIRHVLAETRIHLRETLSHLSDDQLGWVPEALKQRGLTLREVLHILPWHEAHHHGQAHAVLNLYKAAAGRA